MILNNNQRFFLYTLWVVSKAKVKYIISRL